MVWIVLYLYVLGLFLLTLDDWDYLRKYGYWYDWIPTLTWPLFPLWLTISISFDKYQQWKWDKEQKEYEKMNRPPIDNEPPIE